MICSPMKLVTVILLIHMVCAPLAGARILESDFQASWHADSKLNTVLGGSQKASDDFGTIQIAVVSGSNPDRNSPNLTHQRTTKLEAVFLDKEVGSADNSGLLITDSTLHSKFEQSGGKLDTVHGSGVGHMRRTDPERPAQSMPETRLSNLNILPSEPGPGNGHRYTDTRTERKVHFTEMSKKSTFNKLPSGSSPGVGHSFTNGHVEKIQAFSKDLKERTFNKLPSGPSSGVGHSFTDDRVEKIQAFSEDQKQRAFNKLPSGPSPGVGNSFTNGHVEKIQAYSKDQKQGTFNKLPSGPSPGVGNSFTDGRVEKIQAFSENRKQRTFNKLPSGPSPGVGHSITEGHVEKIQALSEHRKQGTFNKLPSGSSPGVGHSFIDGHVEKIQVSDDEKQRTFNNFPSGRSPAGKRMRTIEPQSGPSPGAGHMQTNSNNNQRSMASIVKTESAFAGAGVGVGHSIPTGTGRKFNSENRLGDWISRVGHAGKTNLQINELKSTSSQKPEAIAMEKRSEPSERIGCAVQGDDQFSGDPLFAVPNLYSRTPGSIPEFGVARTEISPEFISKSL